jgi:hypothetical protein
MGGQWHHTRRRIYIYIRKEELEPLLGSGFLPIRRSYKQLRGLILLVIGCHT